MIGSPKAFLPTQLTQSLCREFQRSETREAGAPNWLRNLTAESAPELLCTRFRHTIFSYDWCHETWREEKPMAGSLFHAESFDRAEYLGNDGKQHFEIVPTNGDIDVISISSIHDLRDYCIAQGVPIASWPEYEDDIDLSIEDVLHKNEEFRTAFLHMPQNRPRPDYWADKVRSYLLRNEKIFFCQ